MLLPEQLELRFSRDSSRFHDPVAGVAVVAGVADPGPLEAEITDPGYSSDLECLARELLRINGAARIVTEVRVEWNPRLKTCAGRTDYRNKLISLNPRLRQHPGETDRTLRHELAHLLAQFRVGKRKRIRPHGPEWRQACRDLGISDEKRCHDLPFPISERIRRFLYKCPNCRRNFARARRIRRVLACLACCRAYNKGEFDKRFRLRLVHCSGGL